MIRGPHGAHAHCGRFSHRTPLHSHADESVEEASRHQGGHTQVSVEAGYADCVRQFPSHQPRSRRMADRLLTIGSVKKDALSRQSVKVRSDHMRLTIAIQFRP